MTATTRKIGIFAWLIIGLAMLFYLYDFFLQVSPSVMVQQLMKSFNLEAFQLGNLSAFYFYIYTVMQVPVGVLYDRFGVRWLMIGAVAISTIGSFLFGFSIHIGFAQFSRFLMGLGSSFAFVGVLKIAATYLPANRIAIVTGITTALGMVGAMVGNLLLTKFVLSVGWRWGMIVGGFGGLAIFIGLGLCLFYFKEPSRKQRKKDQLLKPLLIHLLDTVRRPSMWVNAIISFLLFIPINAFANLWGVPYLKQAQHFSPTSAAVINSLMFLGVALGGPFWGWLSDRVGRRKIFIFIATVLGAVTLSCIIYIEQLNLIVAGGLFLVTGFLIATQTLTFPIAKELSPPAIVATAFAFTNLVINLGGSIFQPVVGAILDSNWVGRLSALHVPVFGHSTFSVALTLLPVSYVLAFLLTFFLRETYCKQVHNTK